MRYPTGSLVEQLKSSSKTIEETLGKLKKPTQKMAEKAVRDLLPSSRNDASALIPFTGYYSINKAAGAFFSIDTAEVYINFPLTKRIMIRYSYPIITINVSLDGKTFTSYPFDSGASFDGKTLKITGVLQVSLVRGYQGGQLVTLSGTISGNTVSGSTYFNPVELPVFVGTYKEIVTKQPKLTVANSSLMFDFGAGLQNIRAFTYNPAMYVVQFENAGVTYTLMLGTAAKQGLACFITNGTSNDFAVTIP
jgi:hypothetical protein